MKVGISWPVKPVGRYVLAGVVPLLLGVAIYLGIDLHRAGREQVLRQYNALQQLLAKEAAHEAVLYLTKATGHVEFLGRRSSIQRGDSSQIPADLALYHDTAESFQGSPLAVVNTDGRVVFSTGGVATNLNCAGCEFFDWARKRKNKGQSFVSSWSRENLGGAGAPAGEFFVATPLYQQGWDESTRRSVQSWSGVLLMTLDLGKALGDHMAALSQGSHARLWIMDQDGTVLLQSEHPEMARQNVFRTAPECAQCHVSFDYARRMLVGEAGATEYQLKGGPKKLAAFVPLSVANASWVMVVNAPYHEVTAFVGREYRRTLLLLGVVGGALSLASVAFYRANVSRRQAREEVRQWRMKLELEERLRRAEERYRTLFEESPDGILVTDPESLLPIEFNDAAHRQLGYSREEFGRMRACDHEPGGDLAVLKSRVKTLLAEGKARFEIEQRTKAGTIRKMEVIAQTLRIDERTVLHCLHHDVTDRSEAAENMARRTAQLEALYKVSLGIAAETDTHALLRMITNEALKLFRANGGGLLLYRREQQALEWAVSAGGDPKLVGTLVKKGEGLAGRSWETGGPLMACSSDPPVAPSSSPGEGVHASAIAAPLRWGEDFLGVLQLNSNVPGLWAREEAALLGLIATQAAIAVKNAALLERVRRDDHIKTTLLHDVNHRVKNNLARLLEIVRLEREQTARDEPDCRVAFHDLENRLRGMEMVHTMLSTAQWHSVPLGELATQIVSGALSGSPIRERIRVSVLAPSDPVQVVPEQATAVALILSELTSNSVKHAFYGRAEGRLEVRVGVEDGQVGRPLVRVLYRDDGPGWPADVLGGKTRQVGLHLIQASVRSPLRGELSLRNEGGAVAELTFRLALTQ